MTDKKPTTKKRAPAPIFTDIRGKKYETVASRLHRFRFAHPMMSLVSDIISLDESSIVIRAAIMDDEGRVVATGHAEENRGQGMINKTSALENGETSAWGRCLSNFGFDASGNIASADEVENAIAQQDTPAPKAAAPKPVAKPVSSQTALANDRQKTEIRAAFKGLGLEASIALRKDLLEFGMITLPGGVDPERFTLAQVDSLLTEAGAARFINRPPF